MTTGTWTNKSLGWSDGEEPEFEPILHLVIAWSRDEPHRIGEAIPIDQGVVLGRGHSVTDDTLPRAVLVQHRPSSVVPQSPLTSMRISRSQLRLAPLPDGRVVVTSVGRCLMSVNGLTTSTATVAAGDVVTLHHALILLAVMRPAALAPLRGTWDTSFPFGTADRHGIIGESSAAWALRDSIAIAARSPNHVLIHGPSGVGKELAARAIHVLSERKLGPFITRNAATFPEGLVDSELFGTAKGYPNAGVPERPGLIGEAEGGTLFLDEIGELPTQLQAHLLRVLDGGGEYQRLGDARVRRANVRLVGATNRSLESLKHDFAARFTTRVEIPGLESRADDIPLLLRHLFNASISNRPEVAARYSSPTPDAGPQLRIGPDLVEALLRHPYTLHVRELLRLLECSIATSPKNFLSLTPAVAAELGRGLPDDKSQPKRPELDITRAEIEAALDDADGNVTKAANQLGLKNRFSLYRLMKRHGLTRADDEESS